MRGVNPILRKGNFFGVGHLQALAFLQDGNKASPLQQAVVRTGIEPGVTADHDFHVELALLQVAPIDICDFQLATRRRVDAGSNVSHLAIVEIQAGQGVIALGCFWFFLDGDRAFVGIEFDHAVTLGVVHMVGKHAGTALPFVSVGQLLDQVNDRKKCCLSAPVRLVGRPQSRAR